MNVNSTAGDAAANSYVSRTEAETYFTSRYNASAWHTAQPALKDAALVTASLAIDDNIAFIGERTTTTQSMEWPRIVDSSYNIADTDIPTKIKRSVFEAALYLLQSGTLEVTSEVDSIKLGSITINLNQNRPEVMLPNRVVAAVGYLGTIIGAAATSLKNVRLGRA